MPSELATDTAGPLAVEAYRRFAELQVVFASICAAEGCPLTGVQEVLLAQTVAQCSDGTQAMFASLLTCESELRTGRFPFRDRFLLDPEVGA